MDWLYPLSGFVVGAIVGLTGMGGGSLMKPLLILVFGVHPLTAVGTDLLYAAVTTRSRQPEPIPWRQTRSRFKVCRFPLTGAIETLIFLPARRGGPFVERVVNIDPVELEAAQEVERPRSQS